VGVEVANLNTDKLASADVRGSLTERQRKRLRGQGKSDPRDALAIARVTVREQLPPVRVDSLSRDLKLLCDYRAQLIAERVRTANRLHVDLVSLRPGYERQIRNLGSSVQLERAQRLLAGDQSVQVVLARRRIEKLRQLDTESTVHVRLAYFGAGDVSRGSDDKEHPVRRGAPGGPEASGRVRWAVRGRAGAARSRVVRTWPRPRVPQAQQLNGASSSA
jgi:hypothetical protein